MRNKLLYVIAGLLVLCTFISVSYAYYTISPSTKQDISASSSFTNCLSLNVSSVVNISGNYAVPISDTKALSYDNYRVALSITNSCSESLNVKLAYAPGSANTLAPSALKYAIYEQSGTKPTSGSYLLTKGIALSNNVISDVAAKTGDTVSIGYELTDSITLSANSTKSYYVYTWIDENEGDAGNNTTMNKVVSMHLVLSKAESISSTFLASSVTYSNPAYTTCTTLECALDELYNITNTSSGPTSYWFASGTYTFPNYGGTLQTSGTATGHNVYIGQDDNKYYTCINVDGKEACLSQPYTQYGLEGHTSGSDFTAEQQHAVEAAIGEVFSDAGITEYSCDSDSYYATCYVGVFNCSVRRGGDVYCDDYGAGERCYVNADGSADCYLSGGSN